MKCQLVNGILDQTLSNPAGVLETGMHCKGPAVSGLPFCLRCVRSMVARYLVTAPHGTLHPLQVSHINNKWLSDVLRGKSPAFYPNPVSGGE